MPSLRTANKPLCWTGPSSRQACDGWLHVMGSVLLPAQQFRCVVAWGAAAWLLLLLPLSGPPPTLPLSNAAAKQCSGRCAAIPLMPQPWFPPTIHYSNLPRLVDTVPDLPPDAFWQLLDGTNMPSSPPPADPQPPDTDAGSSSSSGDAPKQPHSGTTALVVSGDSSQSASQAPPQLDGSSGSSNSTVLVVAASCAGAAVALCIAVVGVVLWRKRSAAAARRRGRQQVDDEADEDGMSVATSKSAGSGGQQHGGWRPVQLHVDA